MGTPANAVVQQEPSQAAVRQDTQQPAPAKKPSIWRQILGLALIGGGAGMAARNPSESAEAGRGAVERMQDRELERGAFDERQQRERAQETRAQTSFETQQELHKAELERVRGEIKAMPDEAERRRANNALLQVQLQLTQRQLLLLPETKQEAILDKGRAIAADFMERGIPTVWVTPGEGDDLASAQALLLRAQNKDAADGTLDFGYQLLPHPTKKDAYVVFQTPPNKFLSEPGSVKVGGKTVPIPVGTSMDTYARLKLEGAIKDAELEFERHRADAKADYLKPITLKESLAQARQEIVPLIEADSFVPDSRKQYKNQADVTAAVNKRAKEILDLDGQLRRSGIEQPRNVMGVLGQLKTLRQRGASDVQLKAGIAQAAMLGQLSAAEIIVLYDALGLVPDISKAQPTTGNKIGKAAQKGAAGYEVGGGVRVPR
jgi:hypothetical protein